MHKGLPRRDPRWLAGALLLAPAAGCGEPAVDLAVPERQAGQVVLDQAGILDVAAVADALQAVDERDVVALTYETEQASRGEANRAGRLLLDAWGADIALVAVARPGDFSSTVVDREDAATRQRFFGIEPADTFAVPGSLREEIAEGLVPPLAERNDWDGVFTRAAGRLAEGLGEETPG